MDHSAVGVSNLQYDFAIAVFLITYAIIISEKNQPRRHRAARRRFHDHFRHCRCGESVHPPY